MALVKTVELRVLAKAGDAQAQLDEIAAKGDELGANGIRMRFRLEGGAEGKAQLDEIQAKADKLGFKDVSIKVKVDGKGRAIADLAAIKAEADKAGGGGIMSKIGGLIGGAGGAIPGSLGPVSLPALAAAVPVAGALATELVGVASGFAAAGAGAGAFALLALPAVKQVEAAYSGLSKAQQAFNQAQAKEAADPTKSNAKAVQAAALNLKLAQEQIAKLPASEQAAIKGTQGLVSEFGKLSKAFQPQAFKVFADGLKIAKNLLPSLKPFADTAASSIDGLLKKFAKFTEPSSAHAADHLHHMLSGNDMKPPPTGWEKFLDSLHKIEGPAMNSIGTGLGKVGAAFGHLLTIMSGKDVAHALNIAFGAIAGTINAVASGIHMFMQNFDSMKATATRDAHEVASAFDSLRHGAAEMGHGIASAFDTVRHGIATFVSSIAHGAAQVVTTFLGLPGKILAALGNVGSLLFNAGKAIIQGLINGIKSMIGAIGGAIGGIVSKIRSFLPFSPAKEGPLSGLGSPDIAGAKIASMIASGMDSGTGLVSRSAARLAGAASISGGGGYGYGGGGVHVHINGVITDPQAAGKQIVQVLQQYKRAGGRASLGLG